MLLLLQLVAPFLQRPPSFVQAAAPLPVSPPAPEAESAARVAEKLGQMPITFEQNLGQTDDRVKFTARGRGYGLFLTPTEARLALSQGKNKRPLTLQMQLVGGNPNPAVTGLEQTGTVSNYYLGNDPAKFRTGVPHFAKVKYAQVYPGIDAVYYGQGQMLEYDFVVAPGADPRVIQMTFKGARKLSLDTNGDLVIQTKGGELRQHKPVVYQDVNGVRQAVAGRFVLRGKQVGFAIGDYDRSKELVIDPTLNYSTYVGGYDGDEKGYAIVLDGVRTGLSVTGAMDGETMLFFVEELVVPRLKRGEIVVLDNSSIHKQEEIEEAIEAVGAWVLFLPPYSPDLNPIENGWSKVKAILRALKPRTFDALQTALVEAFAAITAQDLRGWFGHCGYGGALT